MKKTTKIIALLMAVMMMALLCACGKQNNDSNNGTAQNNDSNNGTAQNNQQAEEPKTPANALEQIKADGVLTVALSPDFTPMEFVDSSKEGQEQYVGFDVSLANFIA